MNDEDWTSEPPGYELDHFFICTSIGAPEAARLVAFGLTEGTPNTHPGQGTACRRFFFRNAYLELLWVHDRAEAKSELTSSTHLWERWDGRSSGRCSFGFCLRPQLLGQRELPFGSWAYHPQYLPSSLSIQVATNAGVLAEPMLFFLEFAQRPDSYPTARRQPLEHPSGLRAITRVEFVTPRADKLSPELQAVADANLVRLCAGTEYLLELGFDGESQRQKMDFRPALPLVFCW